VTVDGGCGESTIVLSGGFQFGLWWQPMLDLTGTGATVEHSQF